MKITTIPADNWYVKYRSKDDQSITYTYEKVLAFVIRIDESVLEEIGNNNSHLTIALDRYGNEINEAADWFVSFEYSQENLELYQYT